MFDYLSEDDLKKRLGVVYLLLSVLAITMFISAFTTVNVGVKWVLVLLTFGLIGFEVFKQVRHKKGVNTQSTGSPEVATIAPA